MKKVERKTNGSVLDRVVASAETVENPTLPSRVSVSWRREEKENNQL